MKENNLREAIRFFKGLLSPYVEIRESSQFPAKTKINWVKYGGMKLLTGIAKTCLPTDI